MKCLFVGSFRATAEGREGGQFTQCRLLLGTRPAEGWQWISFDVTDESVVKTSVFRRCARGARRLASVRKAAKVQSADCALVFTSCYPFSLLEKGLIGALLRANGLRVYFSYRSQLPPDMSFATRLGLRLCHFVGHGHFVQSELAVSSLVSIGFSSERVALLRNIVEHEFWVCPAAQRDPGIPAPVSLIFVGWLEPIKGLDILMDALRLVTERGVEWELNVYGAGNSEADLRRRATEYGIDHRIHWNGWCNREVLRTSFARADLLVLPSRSEGLPNVILEAFSAAVPVIATAVGGVPELIVDGVNGVLVAPGDVHQLANAIERVSNDREGLARMGVAALREVKTKFAVRAAEHALASLMLESKAR